MGEQMTRLRLSAFAKASIFAKASSFAKASEDKPMDKPADRCAAGAFGGLDVSRYYGYKKIRGRRAAEGKRGRRLGDRRTDDPALPIRLRYLASQGCAKASCC